MARRKSKEQRDDSNAIGREASANIRDIAVNYPGHGNAKRRQSCKNNLRLFLETYFASAFNLAWSDDHLRVIATLEEVALKGGTFALGMPRGGGKTTLAIRAAMWAMMYGHRKFLMVVAATAKMAKDILETIKSQMYTNKLLLEDFPHICYPIKCLENNSKRCIGQLFEGEMTRIVWAGSQLVLPTMPKSAIPIDCVSVNGSRIVTAGLTGAVRGQQGTPEDGSVIRPDLIILDDPQTRQSAMSADQTKKRIQIITSDIMGSAGPGVTIAAVMPCTVIRPGDLSDEYLDRRKHPQWHGEKCKMLYAFPKAMKLWDRYKQIWDERLLRGSKVDEEGEFYRGNRAAMDEGAIVGWKDRYNKSSEQSAIHAAMKLYVNDQQMFMAEYQNEPFVETGGDSPVVTKAIVVGKLNGFLRSAVPAWAEKLTAFIDVHNEVLYYAVCAWSERFDGAVIDYGTYPDQQRHQFTLRTVTRTLQSVGPAGCGQSGWIQAGLTKLAGQLCGKAWHREDGAVFRIERCLIDAGWHGEDVKQFYQRSLYGAVLLPSMGDAIKAANRPIEQYNRTKGDRIGFNWWIPKALAPKVGRHFRLDTNFWKTFLHTRLATAFGDLGCLSLWGKAAIDHDLIADHIVSEVSHKTQGHGRTLDEYVLKPGVDNHWLDCLVGCAAAASLQGVTLAVPGARPAAMRVIQPRKTNRVRYV
jgi:hypothetical protein